MRGPLTPVFDLSKLLVYTGLRGSRSEVMRLIKQGAVELDGRKVDTHMVPVRDGSVVKVGARQFLRMVDADRKKP